MKNLKKLTIIASIVLLIFIMSSCVMKKPTSGAVTLKTPANKQISVSVLPVFKWENTELDGIKYDIYYGKDELPSSAVKSDISAREYTVSSKLDYNTKYMWKVVSKGNGAAPVSSTVWEFTTVNLVNLSYPANAQSNVATDTMFNWTVMETPGATFDLYYGIGSIPADPVARGLTAVSYQPVSGLEKGKNYVWKVKAQKDGKVYETPEWNFVTQGGIKLLTPAHKSENLSVSNMKFTWESDFASATYDIVYGYEGVPREEISYNGLTLTDFTETQKLKPGKEYFWKVTGHNGGEVFESPVATFTTVTVPIEKVMLKDNGTGSDNRMACVLEDELYFIRNFDIYVSKSSAGTWQDPQQITELSLKDKNEISPFVLKNGEKKVMYFLSNRNDVNYQVFRSEYSTVETRWATPVVLTEFDTKSAKWDIWVSSDETTALITTRGLYSGKALPAGVDSTKYHIWKLTNNSGTWSDPVSVDEINSKNYEIWSVYKDGSGNIWFDTNTAGAFGGHVLKQDLAVYTADGKFNVVKEDIHSSTKYSREFVLDEASAKVYFSTIRIGDSKYALYSANISDIVNGFIEK